MTLRELYKGLLTELSKVNAPSILIEDFNYFATKATQQVVNKRYNIYNISLLTTDDLRVLKSSALLTPDEFDLKDNPEFNKAFKGIYEVILPTDYLHLLNCICIYKCNTPYKCTPKGEYVQYRATRLTEDSLPLIMEDYYNRPLPERPYYYINQNVTFDKEVISKQTDSNTESLKFLKSLSLIENSQELIVSKALQDIRMEIRCGDVPKGVELEKVLVEYIRTPKPIHLTYKQVNMTEDTSDPLEFPYYMCLEIMNELVSLVLSNISDTRLNTHIAVTPSILSPTQQLTPTIPSRRHSRYY